MANQINEFVFRTYEQAFWQFNTLQSQKAFSGSNKDLWTSFTSSIKKAFGLTITFNRELQPILSRVLDTAYNTRQFSIEDWKQTLNNALLFSQMLHQHKFIRTSNFNAMEAHIEGHLNSPLLELMSKAKRLGSARTREEFEEEWEEEIKEGCGEFWQREVNARKERREEWRVGVLAMVYHSCVRWGKVEELQEDMQARLETLFENMSGMNQRERAINQSLEALAFQYSLENRAQVSSKLNTQFKYICHVLEQLFRLPIFQKLQIKIGKFGSVVNGFATTDADMDITICTNSYIKETWILETVNGYLKSKLDTAYKLEYISNANVPVVKIDKEKDGVKIDIIVNNLCGIINSRYLRVYSEMSKSVKYLGILIKLWAKKKGLISQKTLSSYSFILLMIYYLVKKQVVENILRPVKGTDYQKSTILMKRYKNPNEEKFAIDNFFDFAPAKKQKLRFSLLEHLKGFVKFYGPGGEYWDTQEVISMLPTDKERQEDKIFTINDPFDTPHNPGRARNTDKEFFMNSFEDAYKKFDSLDKMKIEALFTN